MNANIVVEFQKGFLSDEEMSELKLELESVCPIEFCPQDTRILAAFDDIISAVTVYITPEFWTQLYAGLALTGICSEVRFAISKIKKVIQNKKGHKVTSDGVEEKDPAIGIRDQNVNIILPTR